MKGHVATMFQRRTSTRTLLTALVCALAACEPQPLGRGIPSFIDAGDPTNDASAPVVDGDVPRDGGAHDLGDGDEPGALVDGAVDPHDAGVVEPQPNEDATNGPVTFAASNDNFLNPERGFYTTTLLTNPGELDYVREEGKTLVYAAVHLQDYLPDNHEQDLPANLLDDVRAGFTKVREAGVKAIVRFQYDDGEGYPGGANDASEAFMKRHIEQVAPVLAENEDVLFLLQAGFIGAWGEWHTSLNFVDGPGGKDARERVFEALLASVPESRRIALRYPAYKRMFYGSEATTWAEVGAGSERARAAHLNDCFVSSDDDVGTYQYEPMETLKSYLEDDTRYVPIGGETCATDPRNACDVTMAEMARFHWTYINDQYHPEVLARWVTEGCRGEIERRLGYRLALTRGSLPEAVRPGGSFVLDLTVENQGYAALTNPRPVEIVLSGGGQTLVAELSVDPRSWLPGEHRITARLRVPANLAPGTYRLALWLPDAAESLRDRPAYAVRLANQGVWNESDGTNTLAQLSVRDDAPGSRDQTATAFTVIP